MSVLGFIASIVKSIAWPLVVMFCVLLFRKQIEERITSILKISRDGVEFDKRLRETMLDVNASVQLKKLSPKIQKSFSEKLHLSENTAMIVAAWRELENLVRRRLIATGIDISSMESVALIQTASDHNLITDEQRRSLSGLNALRNLAVHGREDDIDERRTKEFLTLADAMKTVLNITEG